MENEPEKVTDDSVLLDFVESTHYTQTGREDQKYWWDIPETQEDPDE